MANPLAILGGLATVGAQGASGALEGEVVGEDLKRKYASQDVQNQLHVLEMILKGQQVRQSTLPTTDVSGGHIINRAYPHGPVTSLSELPETTSARAAREAHEASAGLHRAQAGQVGVPTDPTHAWQKRLGDALAAGDQKAADQALGVLNSFADIHARQGAPRQHFQTKTDATGRVTGLVFTQKPDGNWKVDQLPLGAIGAPPAGAAGLTPRQTLTTTTKFTPRKEIKDDRQLNAINAALPDVVNELSRKPGFTVPGGFVTLPNGMRVRKEDIIAQAFKQKFGAEVSVRWDGRKFVLVKAWEPEQREPIETRRSVGPPSTIPSAPDEETDSAAQ